jgi:hypothetical protein
VIVGGRHQFFPSRALTTLTYSIEDTYQGLYQQLRGFLRTTPSNQPAPNQLTYARYGLWGYVKRDKQGQEPYASLHHSGANLRGLMRILLFKRFESSVYAFQQSIRRLLLVHERFNEGLESGIVAAGEDAQAVLYEPNQDEELDILEALRRVSGRYDVADFDIEPLKKHIRADIRILRRILELVAPITPDRDAKLQKLKRELDRDPLRTGKRLIFTQYADTARYLFENLNPKAQHDDIEVIFSGDKSKARVVGRFAPKANPEYRFALGESEVLTLIATDVLSEGLNLQDCNKIVNYDLHWNPVRLIQRFGRIDRIGSEHDVVFAFNFLPETGIDRNLDLRQTLDRRIQEIHDTIGEDSAILDPSERLNREAMYAIYEKDGAQLGLFEEEEPEFIDLNEAEEIMRQLRHEDPAQYERIAQLRDGIRSARSSGQKGMYVFCAAGNYRQLFLVGEDGEVVSRDLPRVLGAVKCGPLEPTLETPAGYNAAVMRVQRQFTEEVKHRRSEREHTLSLSVGQRYAVRELGILFRSIEDEDRKAEINLLDRAFRLPVTGAVNRELNLLRRNGVTGEDLFKSLLRTYNQHSMREWLDRQATRPSEDPARIICSEGLL